VKNIYNNILLSVSTALIKGVILYNFFYYVIYASCL